MRMSFDTPQRGPDPQVSNHCSEVKQRAGFARENDIIAYIYAISMITSEGEQRGHSGLRARLQMDQGDNLGNGERGVEVDIGDIINRSH